MMASDGSLPVNLTKTPNGEEDDPVWLPDGRILFMSNRDGNWELYAMNPDGTNTINLTQHPADDMRSIMAYRENQIERGD